MVNLCCIHTINKQLHAYFVGERFLFRENYCSQLRWVLWWVHVRVVSCIHVHVWIWSCTFYCSWHGWVVWWVHVRVVSCTCICMNITMHIFTAVELMVICHTYVAVQFDCRSVVYIHGYIQKEICTHMHTYTYIHIQPCNLMTEISMKVTTHTYICTYMHAWMHSRVRAFM